MKSKLIKFFIGSFIVCLLVGVGVSTPNSSDILDPYGQAVPTTNQLIINI